MDFFPFADLLVYHSISMKNTLLSATFHAEDKKDFETEDKENMDNTVAVIF